eukprot:scaffold34927_cov234-Amphora_coffeaeformis.AAC.1
MNASPEDEEKPKGIPYFAVPQGRCIYASPGDIYICPCCDHPKNKPRNMYKHQCFLGHLTFSATYIHSPPVPGNGTEGEDGYVAPRAAVNEPMPYV